MGFIKGLGVFVLSIILIFLILMSSFSFLASSLLHPQIYYNSLEQIGAYNSIEQALSQTDDSFVIKEGPKNAINNIISNFLSYMRSETGDLNITLTISKNNSEEKINLEELLNIRQGSEARKSLENIRGYLELYKLLNIMLIVLVVIFLFLIYLLKSPKTKGFLRISSVCFLFSALLLLSLAHLINETPNFIGLNEFISAKMMAAITNSIIEILFKHITIFASISLAFLLLSFIVKNKSTENNKLKSKKNEKSNNSTPLGRKSKK